MNKIKIQDKNWKVCFFIFVVKAFRIGQRYEKNNK